MTSPSTPKLPQADTDLHHCCNWSGSLRFRPARLERPSTEAALAALVREAGRQGRTVRPIGSAHSSTGIIATDDILVSLERLRGVAGHDPQRGEATVGAGSRLDELGRDPLEVDYAVTIESDVPIVIQLARFDCAGRGSASLGTLACSDDRGPARGQS